MSGEEFHDRRQYDVRLSHLEDAVARHDERLRSVGGDVHDVKQVLTRLDEKLSVHVAQEDADRGRLTKELKDIRKDLQALNTDFEKRGAFFTGVAWLGGVITVAVATGASLFDRFKGG